MKLMTEEAYLLNLLQENCKETISDLTQKLNIQGFNLNEAQTRYLLRKLEEQYEEHDVYSELFTERKNYIRSRGWIKTSKAMSREEICSRLKEIANMLNKTPTQEDIAKVDGNWAFPFLIRKVFVSYAEALEEAGLKPNKAYHEYWNYSRRPETQQKKEVIRLIREFYRENGYVPTARQLEQLRVDEEGKWPSVGKISRLFGSISKMVEAAELPKGRKLSDKIREEVVAKAVKQYKNRDVITRGEIRNEFGAKYVDSITAKLKETSPEIIIAKNPSTVQARKKLDEAAKKNFPEHKNYVRERECSMLFWNGQTLQEIANEYKISRQMVSMYIQNYARAVHFDFTNKKTV